MKDVLNLEVTIPEVSHILGLSEKKVRTHFKDLLYRNKVSNDDVIKVQRLKGRFGTIKSIDNRYHDQCKLCFMLQHSSDSYKKHLNDPELLVNGKFTNGKTIYYKICSKAQKEHIKTCLDHKRKANILNF